MAKNLFYFLFFFSTILSAQDKKSIDSINAIPFEIKLKNSSTLSDTFLKNAQNAQKINYQLGEAESYSNLSLINYLQGKYEKDLSYSLRAISIFEKIDAKEKLATEYGELGYRMKKRNMPKALFYMQKAKLIAEENHLQKPLLSIYDNYGVLKEMQKQYDSAFNFYGKSLAIKESIKDSIGIPYSLNNMAGIYVFKKQFTNAKLLADKALRIRELKKDENGITESYICLGDLYLAQNDFKTSISYFEKSLEKAKKYNFAALIGYSYQKLSENYEGLKNSDEALKYYKLYSEYKDGLLNKETNSKIAELEVKFETNKKEKQLLQEQIETKKTRNKLIAVSSLAFFLGLIGFLIYRQQKLKNTQQAQEFQLKTAISQIETQNQLHEQRLSISRDLHDNIGAQLTFVISSIDNLKFGNKITDSKINNQLNKISDFTKSTIIELRDTIWAMNSPEFSVDDFYARLVNFIEKAKSSKDDITFKFHISEDLRDVKFSSLIGINLYRTIQEAINNAIKYSEAKNITLHVFKENDQIKIEIKDDGKGFDTETTELGNGLYNMKKRMEEVDGFCEIKSTMNKGTSITILLPKTVIS
ncbi:MAG: tetratricopeptide repeat protein [Chryseobacterium sp.]|nr:tetratricopeptide repeat protein [Chryseobacterium sp.]